MQQGPNPQGKRANEALYTVWKFCNKQEFLDRLFFDLERFNKDYIPTTCPEDDEVIEITLADLKDMFAKYIHHESELQLWYHNILIQIEKIQKEKEEQQNKQVDPANKQEQKVNDEETGNVLKVKADDDSGETSNDSSTNDNTLSLSHDTPVNQPTINIQVSKQQANYDSQSNDNAETILKMWLSWIKELPEWLQDHYMNSHAIKDLIKYIESSSAKPQDAVTIFDAPKESDNSYTGNIPNIQEELAQAKIEQTYIEMPEDITMANWLMSSVPTLHLPTEIAICALSSFIPSSYDSKNSVNIMPAACIAKLGYDAVSSYFLGGNESSANLVPQITDPVVLEA